MMDIFSPKTISDWQARGITDVSFFLVSGGCAGEKVTVIESPHPDMDSTELSHKITFHFKKSESDFFNKAKLTEVSGKWIVANREGVLGHCSCGSSFKRKTGNPLMDKAETLRLALKKSQSNHHT